jgi:Tfp pilus assembly PilM family ATPase
VKRRPTLPLGIDVGSARTRVALLECDPAGTPHLIAVAARPTGDDPAAAIAAAWAELGTRERRCVLAAMHPDALLRVASFPPLGRAERERAARFEATRFVPYPIAEAALRVAPLADGRCVIGAARKSVLAVRLAAAARAKLEPVAVDDGAFALCRAFPAADALIDVGESATTLIVPGEPIPALRAFALGGRGLTAAVAAALGVDEPAAEQRKRSVGLAGAGEHARDELVEQLATALIEIRAAARGEVRAVALVGNGARLTGLADALERAVQVPVRLGALTGGPACPLPPDVVRAAGPDWGLAYGLALWEHAA